MSLSVLYKTKSILHKKWHENYEKACLGDVFVGCTDLTHSDPHRTGQGIPHQPLNFVGHGGREE